MNADQNAGPSGGGNDPGAPYRGGELAEAARAARERAAAEAKAASPLANEDFVQRPDAKASSPGLPARPVTPPAEAVAGAAGLAAATSGSTKADVQDLDPEVQAAVASAVAEAEEAKADRDANDNDNGVLAFFRELPVLLAVAFLLAFLLRTFVVQVFYIPSGSMIPTLEVNDRIVVEKLTYLFREPVRGEVVVFAGDEPAPDPDEGLASKVTRGVGQFLGLVPANARDFVKRVIGLPGDTVMITEGVVMVNGVALDEPYALDDPRDFGPYEVPEGTIFFLGDNRPSSSDSRFPAQLGFVQMDHVVGRAMVIVWPYEHAKGIGTPEYAPIPEG